MNKKGSLLDLPANLLILFIVVTFLIALIPGFVSIIGFSQSSSSLNCHGYRAYNSSGGVDWSQSANDSLPQNSDIACVAVKLYIPYIVLGVLIAGVAAIFYGRSMLGGGQETAMYG